MRDVAERIRSLIEEGKTFTYATFASKNPGGYPVALSPKWFSWTGRTRMLIEATFGLDSAIGDFFAHAQKIDLIGYEERHFAEAHSGIIGALQTGLDALEQSVPISRPIGTARQLDLTSGRVFVVHGHDDALKNELEAFLGNLGLDPVVLHRQPDQGATLIEKFERHSDVGYAFVLLTPDDVACPAASLALPEDQRDYEQRARQNVIFEFGYFAGYLGRSRVCCLYKGEVALPSDISGLVYKRVDGGIDAIGLLLMKELRAAGYGISI